MRQHGREEQLSLIRRLTARWSSNWSGIRVARERSGAWAQTRTRWLRSDKAISDPRKPRSAAPKQYIGSDAARRCRYCGRSEGTAGFNDVAHAVPESIG